jgi:hypothetical protein
MKTDVTACQNFAACFVMCYTSGWFYSGTWLKFCYFESVIKVPVSNLRNLKSDIHKMYKYKGIVNILIQLSLTV